MSKTQEYEDWWIFRGDKDGAQRFDDQRPEPPPWRRMDPEARQKRGEVYLSRPQEKQMVNAAIYLRRPLLVTGDPGIGKSSLAFAVAHELKLGEVLHWPISTRTTLKEGLYEYDAIGRLHDASLAKSRKGSDGKAAEDQSEDVGRYIRLGPLGTALLPKAEVRPRVLLIDEIDKSDIDLPNDLLHLFEEGFFDIPVLKRASTKERHQVYPHDSETRVEVEGGRVPAGQFPIVIMTSNGERDFPPAFLRRCLRLDIEAPTEEELAQIVRNHFSAFEEDLERHRSEVHELIQKFMSQGADSILATDQLLNAVYMLLNAEIDLRETLEKDLLRPLST